MYPDVLECRNGVGQFPRFKRCQAHPNVNQFWVGAFMLITKLEQCAGSANLDMK